ncbi:hypothetical protein BDN71DRAFT_1483564 [Pleurotus eryngii]|uniref:CxC2-like cysteine cluster KDZ transposase-associated domain-containing protein n=1 Tax=Pleurotus eryngii TaxID=5323 RepID=A0A9P5ZT24_PLEER|nr:hypothetical protein BDN71DRAFT_1483564 [Pleurotus eryngii]
MKVWNSRCFTKTSLQALLLCIQLGHGGGKCTNSAWAAKVFTVLHVNEVHLVTVDYCDCEMRVPRHTQLLQAGWYPATIHYPATCTTIKLLKHFHGLSLCSKVSAYEYYLNLERLTDNSQVDISKTRYRVFLRMVWQFHHERMLNVALMAAGDLALTCLACLACPQPGINLPNDWQTISLVLRNRFLYTLFVSVNANFQLKNHLRKNELLNPGLHTGLAYFVPQAPYTEHILKHISQTNISSCSGFAAMSQADSKSMQGLCYTGVGMCICTCHELVHPLEVGDLQKGKQYCNMDYIVLSTLTNLALHALMIIYDIACQWEVNFHSWMSMLPSSLHISPTVQVTYAIPKCHLHAHQISCQSLNSLNLKPSIYWSLINPAANSTKEMGAGSHHDTLDDLFGYHNWLKTIGLGLSLHRNENDVKLWLMEMDKAEARAGDVQMHDKSATVFLSTRLSIEESQYVI